MFGQISTKTPRKTNASCIFQPTGHRIDGLTPPPPPLNATAVLEALHRRNFSASITCGWIRKKWLLFWQNYTKNSCIFCFLHNTFVLCIHRIYIIYILCLYLDWWYVENWRLEARVLYINKLIICGQTFRIHQLKGAFCWSKFEEPFSWKHHETAIWSGSIGPNHPKCCIKCSGKKTLSLMRIESLLPLIHLLPLRMPREANKPNFEGETDLSKWFQLPTRIRISSYHIKIGKYQE